MESVFAIKWDDATGYLRLKDPDYYAIGERKNRHDSADREPMVHFSVGRVELL
jgi:hypothetical protein